MPEITTITSESLQAEVRRLLPSQRGFGSDLEAPELCRYRSEAELLLYKTRLASINTKQCCLCCHLALLAVIEQT